jgi:ABC-type glycerol-3-phosphate transport system substrate-binding protein
MKKIGAFSTLAVVLLLAACSSSSDSATGTSPSAAMSVPPTMSSEMVSPSPAFCDTVAALQTSLDSLKNIDVVKQGTDALQASLTDVKTNLQAVGASAQDLLGPDAQAIQASVDALQTSIDNVKSGTPLTQEAAGIAAGLASLKLASESLVSTAKAQGCTS